MRHWRADVLSAFEKAAKRYDRGDTDLEDVGELFRLAAVYAAENRGITDQDKIQQMLEHSIESVERDRQLEPASDEDVFFEFTIAYIDAHVAAGIVAELEADKIMDYLNDNIDLFPFSDL